VVAYADDVHLQDPPSTVIKAFRYLVAATAEIGLSPSVSKCAAYAQLADTSAAIAAALGIAHHPESSICTSLTCQWATLHNAATSLWSGPARMFEGARLAPILADAQWLFGRHLAELRFASLLVSAPASFEGSGVRPRKAVFRPCLLQTAPRCLTRKKSARDPQWAAPVLLTDDPCIQ
jgi:hypothetical protein